MQCAGVEIGRRLPTEPGIAVEPDFVEQPGCDGRRHDPDDVDQQCAEDRPAFEPIYVGLERDDITMEARFEEDLEVDSLGVVELLMALEDNFDVKIPDDEAEGITTVGQAVDVVSAKLGA